MKNRTTKIILVSLLAILVAVVAVIGILKSTDNSGHNVEYDKELVKNITNIGDINISEIDGFKDGRYKPIGTSDITEVIKEGNQLIVTFNGTEMYNGIYEILCKATIEKEYKEATLYKVGGVTVNDNTNNEVYTVNKSIGSIDNLVAMIKGAEVSSENIFIAPMTLSIKIMNNGKLTINDIEYSYREFPSKEEIQKAREDAVNPSEIDGFAGTFVDENGVTHYKGGVVLEDTESDATVLEIDGSEEQVIEAPDSEEETE